MDDINRELDEIVNEQQQQLEFPTVPSHDVTAGEKQANKERESRKYISPTFEKTITFWRFINLFIYFLTLKKKKAKRRRQRRKKWQLRLIKNNRFLFLNFFFFVFFLFCFDKINFYIKFIKFIF